jgi:hypothetical protein
MGAYAAQVAAAVSGKYERLQHYREILAPLKDDSINEDLLMLIYRAMALGFSEKWVWEPTDDSEPREK